MAAGRIPVSVCILITVASIMPHCRFRSVQTVFVSVRVLSISAGPVVALRSSCCCLIILHVALARTVSISINVEYSDIMILYSSSCCVRCLVWALVVSGISFANLYDFARSPYCKTVLLIFGMSVAASSASMPALCVDKNVISGVHAVISACVGVVVNFVLSAVHLLIYAGEVCATRLSRIRLYVARLSSYFVRIDSIASLVLASSYWSPMSNLCRSLLWVAIAATYVVYASGFMQ